MPARVPVPLRSVPALRVSFRLSCAFTQVHEGPVLLQLGNCLRVSQRPLLRVYRGFPSGLALPQVSLNQSICGLVLPSSSKFPALVSMPSFMRLKRGREQFSGVSLLSRLPCKPPPDGLQMRPICCLEPHQCLRRFGLVVVASYQFRTVCIYGGNIVLQWSFVAADVREPSSGDNRFENASVEFDEETLKPTYRLLWGVPGRSCALNILERLGVPKSILVAAERHLGAANTEINQVITDLEKSKRDFEDDITVAEKYLKNVKVLHTNIKEAVELVQEEEQNSAVYASNMLQEEAHKARASLSALHQRKLSAPEKTPPIIPLSSETPPARSLISNVEGKELMARVGSTVFVPRLGKEAKVVQVLSGKRMVVVQSGSIQLRVSFSDVKL
ncbi:hypothetical protein L7F22_063835 [Adiantum nelumboides]|nr:hypothetical protein [Adiantum nelumboides]